MNPWNSKKIHKISDNKTITFNDFLTIFMTIILTFAFFPWYFNKFHVTFSEISQSMEKKKLANVYRKKNSLNNNLKIPEKSINHYVP